MSLEHPSGSDPQGLPQQMPGLFEGETAGDAVTGISDEVARLYLTAFGRGPTRVRTYVQPEFCVCVLGEILTDAERSLVESGASAEVETAREKTCRGLEADLVAIVERETGRPVLSHLARIKVEVEVTVHFFLFDQLTGPKDHA